MSGCGGEAVAEAQRSNKVLSSSSSLWGCSTPVPPTSSWRWSPAFRWLLYRSLRRPLFRRCGGAAVLVTLFVIGAEMAVGAAVGWRADRPRLPLGVSRWWEPIRDLWSLGRVPGRGFFNDDIVPAFVLDGNCGSLKLSGDGAPSDRGGGVSFRRRSCLGKGPGT